ncbi:MAG: TonB-dependent receptor [Acidobacteria bacterium]|nr:TonB-dependent receptor [Acidobacteriota bacterium]
MISSKAGRLALFLLLSVTIGGIVMAPLPAQITTATILGVVRDETAAVLPGATVTATHLETNQARTVITDDEGRYRVAQLPVGTYEVQAELTGFSTEIRRPITLTIGREAVVDFGLKVGAIDEKIIVTGEASLVETTTATVAGLVDDKKIRDLPLNGRDFAQLALLQEGIVQSTRINRTQAGNEGVKLSLGGTRITQTAFLLDGTDIRNNMGGVPAGASQSVFGVETVREFKVITGAYSAEYGRFSGGVITAVTKSGTNEFHGSIYEFHRNSALDARNFFDRDSANPTVRSDPPPFKRNQFGATLGGPIRKNSTFFFAGYEGLRQRLTNTIIATVPTLAAREGILPTGPVNVAPAARPYLALFPVPNGRELGGGVAEYSSPQSEPVNQDVLTVKIDHNFSPSDSFFARYTFDQSDKKRYDSPVTDLFYEYRYQYLTLAQKKIFSPHVINEARFGLTRSSNRQFPVETVPIDPSLRFSTQSVPVLGRISVSGLSALGAFLQLLAFPTNYEYADDLFYTRGRHSMKMGLSITRFQYNINVGVRTHGFYVFPTLSDFLQARPRLFDGFVTPAYMAGMRQNLFGFYFQDDFKATPGLTLNMGVRYEFITSPVEVAGRISNLRRITDTELDVGNPYFDNPSLKNFSPRIGFAWDMAGDGKTALRGGFGVFYDQLLPYLYQASPVFNPPFARRASAFMPSFPNPFARVQPVNALWALGEPKQPYIMQFSLNLQREIFPDTVLSIGYHGSQGRKLPRLTNDANIAIPTKVDGRTFFPAGGQKRNPNFVGVRMELWDANSFYNALRIGLNKRFSHGVQFQLSYNSAKSIDDSSNVAHYDSSGDVSSPDPDDHKSGRGFSSIHIRHAFTFNGAYDLPVSAASFGSGAGGAFLGQLLGGWQINGILTAATGGASTLSISFDQARSLQAELSQRPELRPGASNNPVLSDGRDPNRYFDVGAFTLAPPGFFGNVARNTLIIPGILTVDFGLRKNIVLHENKILQFRAEFFNILNRANFGLPGTTVFVNAQGVVAPTAGRIFDTSTTSRQIQFALKIEF